MPDNTSLITPTEGEQVAHGNTPVINSAISINQKNSAATGTVTPEQAREQLAASSSPQEPILAKESGLGQEERRSPLTVLVLTLVLLALIAFIVWLLAFN